MIYTLYRGPTTSTTGAHETIVMVTALGRTKLVTQARPAVRSAAACRMLQISSHYARAAVHTTGEKQDVSYTSYFVHYTTDSMDALTLEELDWREPASPHRPDDSLTLLSAERE